MTGFFGDDPIGISLNQQCMERIWRVKQFLPQDAPIFTNF